MLARQNRIRFVYNNKLKHDLIVILNFNISSFVIKPSSYSNVIGTKIDTKNSQSKSRPGYTVQTWRPEMSQDSSRRTAGSCGAFKCPSVNL